MQCIAFATADQYHLPTLCHDLTSHGFQEIDLPRGAAASHCFTRAYMCFREIRHDENCLHFFFPDASNVLVISTDMTAKPEDDALMFFFRWHFIFSQMRPPPLHTPLIINQGVHRAYHFGWILNSSLASIAGKAR